MTKTIFLTIICVSLTQTFIGQSGHDYLFKVFEGAHDEVGVATGYVDHKGDTIIPMAKYYYCYTDTLKTFAIVLRSPQDLIAIDRNDKELYGVFWHDNGPDDLQDGLFRILKNGKIGYADANGNIVIEPQFDCAFPFEKGKAKVSTACKTKANTTPSFWESEHWQYIDKKGKKIK